MSRREQKVAAARARERQRRSKEAKGSWLAFGIWLFIVVVAILLGREGDPWRLVWVGGASLFLAISLWRTFTWLRVR